MLSFKRQRSQIASNKLSNEKIHTKSTQSINEETQIAKEIQDRLYEEYLSKKEEKFLLLKHKSMCQKTLIIDCKRCEICLGVEDNKRTILCDLCEDAFHLTCLGKTKVPDERFYCPTCLDENSDKLCNLSYMLTQGNKKGKQVLKVRSLTFIIHYYLILFFF